MPMSVQKQLPRTFVRDANKVSYHRREKYVDEGCLTGVAAETAAVVAVATATATMTAAAGSAARVAAVVATAVAAGAAEAAEAAVIIITNRT